MEFFIEGVSILSGFTYSVHENYILFPYRYIMYIVWTAIVVLVALDRSTVKMDVSTRIREWFLLLIVRLMVNI